MAATITTGSARPSLRPLSTLMACFSRAGTLGLVSTACPRAASVGVRIAAVSRATDQGAAGDIPLTNRVPSRMVRGMPMSSIRRGKAMFFLSSRRLTREASWNRTKISVISAR